MSMSKKTLSIEFWLRTFNLTSIPFEICYDKEWAIFTELLNKKICSEIGEISNIYYKSSINQKELIKIDFWEEFAKDLPDGSTLIIEKQNFDEFMHLYRKISEIKILEMSQELKAKDKTIFAKDQTIFAKDQTIFAKDQTILLLQEEKKKNEVNQQKYTDSSTSASISNDFPEKKAFEEEKNIGKIANSKQIYANSDTFYTFKKLIKEDQIEFLIKKLVETLSELFKFKIEVSPEYFLEIISLIEEKSNFTNSLDVPIKFDKNSKNSIYRIVIPRIAVGLTLTNDYFLKKGILINYANAINNIEIYCGVADHNDDVLMLKLALLLNSSRALIDSHDAIKSSILLFRTEATISQLSETENFYFEEAKSLFFKLLNTNCAKEAIKKTCEKLNYSNWMKLYDLFFDVFNKVQFVISSDFWGMVGFNMIYLSKSIFALDKKECILARLIGLLFHEGFHFVQRVLAFNFALITPKSKDPNEIEGGLLLELFLWGSYEIQFWDAKHCDVIINIERWKNCPLFNEQELSNKVLRMIMNPRCSGLCVEYQGMAEM